MHSHDLPCPVCQLPLSKTAEAVGKVIVCPECHAHIRIERAGVGELVSPREIPDPQLMADRLVDFYAPSQLRFTAMMIGGVIGIGAVLTAAILAWDWLAGR